MARKQPMPNPFGKLRSKDSPYIVITRDGWEFRVLKLYKNPERSLKDQPYSRVMVAVSSPMTHGGWDMGDSYVHDVPGLALWLRRFIEGTPALDFEWNGWKLRRPLEPTHAVSGAETSALTRARALRYNAGEGA